MPRTEDDGYLDTLLAQLALDQQDVETFRQTTNKLAASHPELMPTHFFSAILAANDEDWLTAESEIKKAEAMGLHTTWRSSSWIRACIRGPVRIVT